MKRTALALALILALLVSTIAGAKLVNYAVANPYPYTNCDSSFVTVSVLSPENKTYDTNSILVTVFAGAYPGVWYVGYSVDGGPFTELAPEKWDGHTFSESVWLNRLSKGSHNIVAEADTPVSPNGILNATSQVYFTITTFLEPVPTQPPTQPSIPYELIYGIALPILGIVVCVGLLVYFKKRGQKLEDEA